METSKKFFDANDLFNLIMLLVEKGVVRKEPVLAEKLPMGHTGYMDQILMYEPGTWGYDVEGRLVLVCPGLKRTYKTELQEEPREFIGTIFQRYSDTPRIVTFGGDWPLSGAMEVDQVDHIKDLLLNKIPWKVHNGWGLETVFLEA